MTVHYHGTPITPRKVLYELAGHHFCVPYSDPRDVEVCHRIGQSVMIDNGAYTLWKRNRIQDTPRSWEGFFYWVKPWLDYHTTWCVMPDVIDGTEEENDMLVNQSIRALGGIRQAAPVWHLHESFTRLEMLVVRFDKVCFGSSGEYAAVGSESWNNRVNEAFNRICRGSGRPPAWIHMLRGMSLSGSVYPFASVDSTDVARNHEQVPGRALKMAQRWDALQCPATWIKQPIQTGLSHEFCNTGKDIS